MGRLSLNLLGGFQARLGVGEQISLPTKKAQALLAYLALPPGQAHPRDKLAVLLWGDAGAEQARHSLRQALNVLRKALPANEPTPLVTTGETLALDPAVVEVDVAAFERLVSDGAPAALEQAAALYQGDLLAGLGQMEAPFEEWLLGERERLRELALEALAKLLRHQTVAGLIEPATQTALRLLALDPWQEAVHRALMRLYVQQGRRGMALKQYQLCVNALQRDLGTEPEPETKQLYQEILRGRAPASAEIDVPPLRRGTRARLEAILPRSRDVPDVPLAERETEPILTEAAVKAEEPARCPACGQTVRPEARFCDGCGQPLTASSYPRPPDVRAPASYTPRHLIERILSQGRTLKGERKEVTILFVDVQGSTELAGALGPEEFHIVLNGAFQLMLDAVHRWEGTVNQFTGDGIMALFGAPIAHEDHAQRALNAALEIRRGFADYAASLRREKGLTLQARLGLNSGPVVVGAIGDDLRMDYTAQGLTTNLAKRMQEAADPGTILAAAPTYRLGEGYFRFQPLGRIRVRGVGDSVEAFVLESEGTVVSRLEASLRRGISPFRGREAELLALGECWERTCNGQGEAICLVGEPGIGKSRLAYEFQRGLGIAERIEGSALSHARGAAYFVFRQVLRQLAGADPTADLAETRERLHRRLWDLSPDLVRLAPDILSILGTACEALALRPAGAMDDRREQLREAASRWLAEECRRAPHLLLIEDLQWLDPSSEELLHHLVLQARGLPLLILMTSRLPLAGRRLELARARELVLQPLPAEDIDALVDAQLEPYSAKERLRRAVAARAEGNPFYVEEMVRAFRERGDLVLEHGAYDLRDGAETIIPATITALISSRIDRLPASARELLANAAVLGKAFPMAYLRGLVPPDTFEDDLAQLERRGFLARQAATPVAGLAFRHVVTQEVAHGMLLQPDRQARHARAAEMLEQLYQGRTAEVCDQLAHHWLHSRRPQRALPYLLSAADGAVAVGANREAIGQLETALRLCTESGPAESGQIDAIRLKLASLHFFVGEP